VYSTLLTVTPSFGAVALKAPTRAVRADHDYALRAHAVFGAGFLHESGHRRTGGSRTRADRDLATLEAVAAAYLHDERVTRTEYGEFLGALARWLLGGKGAAEL
jgi:hypothetical protein